MLKNYTCTRIWKIIHVSEIIPQRQASCFLEILFPVGGAPELVRLLLEFSLVFALKSYIWHRDKTWLFMFVRHCMSSGLPSWEAKDEQFFNRTRVLVHQTSTLATLQLVSSPDPQCSTHTGLAGNETTLQQVAFLSCAVIQSCYRL